MSIKRRSKAAGASYHEATRGSLPSGLSRPGRYRWPPPWALPSSFNGWIVVEVDVPEARQTSSPRKFPRPGLPSSSARMHLPLIDKRQTIPTRKTSMSNTLNRSELPSLVAVTSATNT